ncbi:MAG: hypothetical protein JXJ17_05535 [Anaerolineae bacterium]|nr:hypothetical protein [Anaerolineae bacterium]
MQSNRLLIMGILVVGVLASCTLVSGGQAPAPPPPAEAVISLPTITPTFAPTPIPEPTESFDLFEAGTVNTGEAIFVRDGQFWALSVDGGNERQLTTLPENLVLRDLTLSPDNRYLAFTIDTISVASYDLTSGQIAIQDKAAPNLVGLLAWAPQSDLIYYGKVALDPASIPTSSQVWVVGAEPGSTPELVSEVPLDSGVDLVPLAAPWENVLILVETKIEESGTRLLLRNADGSLVPLTEDLGDVSFLDVSPGLDQYLMVTQARPSTLALLSINAGDGSLDQSPLTGSTEGAFLSARFSASGTMIAAIQQVANGELAGTSRTVIFDISTGPAGPITPLYSDGGYRDLSLAWIGNESVIVQRLNTETEESELWLLPLDGSPGQPLGTGEQVVVVNAP